MLNDTCLLIRQIRQPQQMRYLPNFNTSKYTHYMVSAAQNKVILNVCGLVCTLHYPAGEEAVDWSTA